jgi:hypothetical protein
MCNSKDGIICEFVKDASAIETMQPRVTDQWWIGKDLKRNGRDLYDVLSRHLPEWTEENHDKPLLV